MASEVKTTAINRIVVLDTNVILFDALAIQKFKDAHIHVPISVIEEIDRFKRDLGENGRNARQFSRFIDVLRAKGPLAKGVALNNNTNSKLFVSIDLVIEGVPKEFDHTKADNRILMTAMALDKKHTDWEVELITKDINLRIKADVFGIKARDYEPEKVSPEDMYTGHIEMDISPEAINKFYSEKIVCRGNGTPMTLI